MEKNVLYNLLTFCYSEDSKTHVFECAFQNLIKAKDRSKCLRRIKGLLTKIGQASKLQNIGPNA